MRGRKAHRIDVPFFIFQGADDVLTPPDLAWMIILDHFCEFGR